MQDPELQALTASEPLTIEQEYDMQRSWHEDEDKLTFVVLARPHDDQPPWSGKLVGDVNLFLAPSKDDGDNALRAECEVMIAEPEYRRLGLAREALSLIIYYAMTTAPLSISPDRFFACVGASNAVSLRLFKSLRFIEHKRVKVFDEIELRLKSSFVTPTTMQRAEWPLANDDAASS